MRSFYSLSKSLLLLACIVVMHGQAQALVAIPDQSGRDMPAPRESYVYPWGPEATGFAISPTALLTSAHGGGGPWGYVVDGQYRVFCSWEAHPSGYPDGLDLGIAKLCPGQTPFRGFYRLHRGALTIGESVLMAGSGMQRGAALYSSAIGAVYGYATAPYSNSLTRSVIYSTNRLESVFLGTVGSSRYLYELRTSFDGPSSGRGSPYEGSAAMHDSGGLLAVQRNGEWRAAGMILSGGGGVFNPLPGSTGGASTFLRLLDRPDVLRWIKVKAADAPICLPDVDGSGTLASNDVFFFLTRWFGAGFDWNGDALSDTADLLGFVSEWFSGC